MKMPRFIAKSLACLALAVVLVAVLSAPRLLAQDLRENEPLSQLPVPELGGGTTAPGSGIANFVRYTYLLGISFVAVAAVVSIMYGGAKYMFSSIPGVKEDAKERITNAIIGLALALGAFVILRTINPDLVSFSPIEGDFLNLEGPLQYGPGSGSRAGITGSECASDSDCSPSFTCPEPPTAGLRRVCMRPQDNARGALGQPCNTQGQLVNCFGRNPAERCFAQCEPPLICETSPFPAGGGVLPGSGVCTAPGSSEELPPDARRRLEGINAQGGQ